MRLLTFNTLFRGDVRARLTALGTLLERSEHDVVCLQEVMYRQHVDLLCRTAPSYRHRAYAGGVLLKGGLVLLSRRPITGHHFTPYPMTGPVRTEWLMRKGFQAATIDGLTVVNTHLSANRDDDFSAGNRFTRVQRVELECLAAWLGRLAPDRPVLLVGDLNIPRGKPWLRDLLDATGLCDVLEDDPRPTFRPTPRWPSPPALDHVLVRGLRGQAELVFQDAVTLEDGRSSFLSDHYGVAAELG